MSTGGIGAGGGSCIGGYQYVVTSDDPHIHNLDDRDESVRVGLRAMIMHRARGELSEDDKRLWDRMDELDREQAKGER